MVWNAKRPPESGVGVCNLIEFAPSPLSGKPKALFHLVMTGEPGFQPKPKMLTLAQVISGGCPTTGSGFGCVETEIWLTPIVVGQTLQSNSKSSWTVSVRRLDGLSFSGVSHSVRPDRSSSGV